jgi:2-dehydro-3-deoxyphosphogluconate aldolase/(4S)-4-hydroxy-2-oxoglutarate aldolase
MPQDFSERIARSGVVAVVVVERVEDAVPLAQALEAGGVTAFEMALRAPASMDALAAMCAYADASAPDLCIGAGTVIAVEQVDQVKRAGAAFAVAPGCTESVIRAARDAGLEFAPGIATPSDIERAVGLGCRILKFFPAEPLGGLTYLRAAAAPFVHLGVRFIPLGGLRQDNAASYAQDPLVIALGGSWIATTEAIRKRDWAGIAARARAAVDAVAGARKAAS